MKKLIVITLVLVAVVLVPISMTHAKGRGDGPIIYVYGQGLFYDSIVAAESVPAKGPFQKLEMGGPSPFNLQTEFGPGDRGYVGGRWWLDKNDNGEMDDADGYFVCPLLGPGRLEP